jgi:hypothetical protein
MENRSLQQTVDQDSFWISLAQDLYIIQQQRKELEELEKIAKKELIVLSNNKTATGGKFIFMRDERKGSVDYSKIPELQNVDLDSYRKKPSEIWKLTTI